MKRTNLLLAAVSPALFCLMAGSGIALKADAAAQAIPSGSYKATTASTSLKAAMNGATLLATVDSTGIMIGPSSDASYDCTLAPAKFLPNSKVKVKQVVTGLTGPGHNTLDINKNGITFFGTTFGGSSTVKPVFTCDTSQTKITFRLSNDGGSDTSFIEFTKQ